ncbi:unnamed protein product [Meganyctiphanes norvegica]|uniref:Vitelline membrane outer layer protein 1 homolog n=1 Tax=Meganyctiphanes norvegica TaxID=48144 RepID=A0AAV2RXE1_MEGNR
MTLKPWFLLPLLLVSVQGVEYPPSDFIYMIGATHWGFWGETQVCENGSYVYGLELKVEEDQGNFNDDSALNEIKLFCRSTEGDHTGEVTSSVGEKGIYTGAYHCPGGFMNGFDLKMEAEHNRGDNTAANGVRAYCTSGGDPVEPPGGEWGDWLAEQQFPPGPSKCHSNMVVCGLMTLVQENQGSLHDDTALNDVKFLCCHLPE